MIVALAVVIFSLSTRWSETASATTSPTGERTIQLHPALTQSAAPSHETSPSVVSSQIAMATEPSLDSASSSAETAPAGPFVGVLGMDLPIDESGDWIPVQIERGDTLSLAFARHQLSYRDSLAIANLGDYGARFTRGLRAGDSMRVRADGNGHVLALAFPLDALRTLKVRADDGEYKAYVQKTDVTYRNAYAVGTIKDSFYLAALDAGLPDSVIMDLAYIYGWSIDFAMGIQAGDRFVVIYQELYAHGEKVGNGSILAAEFDTGDRRLRALRFTDADGDSAYYTPDGEAMRRAFLRNALDQFRISSPFSLARDHPILNTIRAHEGTDYAAPTGTPIHVTGDGRITLRGVNGGYGNMVIVDHGNGYTTRYGHMSRFATGQRVGSHVKQGEVIGYVGMTGLATGPHLHYEFRVHGVPKNPVTVDLPGAPPLDQRYMARFKHKTKPLLAQIQTLRHTQLAQANTGH
ncbi:MAG: peptidoglycan DD-metalloendopeptidase family protein [Salinisphaera sp.]|nr:peptidoglycan DD-metalloendopeptidase family protein [Salinisphaera sp.]